MQDFDENRNELQPALSPTQIDSKKFHLYICVYDCVERAKESKGIERKKKNCWGSSVSRAQTAWSLSK